MLIYSVKFNDGRLWASDTHTMYDYFGVIDHLPVSGLPWGLCTGADSSTVHVVCDATKVEVVTYMLQGGWQETSRFETEHGTFGLDISDDTLMCGTSSDVLLNNKDGQKLSSIQQQIGGRQTTICKYVHSDMSTTLIVFNL